MMDHPHPTVEPTRFRQIAQNLLGKTRTGQVNWVRLPERNGSRETSYAVVLPHSRVVLTYSIPRAESDFISLRLESAAGVVVDSWSAEEPEEMPGVHEDWAVLSQLFSEVHRHVTGWDKVLSDIEQAVNSPGKIGQAKPQGLTGTMSSGAYGTLAST